MALPVEALQPVRAARGLDSNEPKPTSCTFSPDLSALWTETATMFKTVSQSFLESPIISAMELIISGLFTKIDDTSFLGVPLL